MWVSEVAMQVSCGYDSIHVVKLQKMLRGCKYKCKSASSPHAPEILVLLMLLQAEEERTPSYSSE